MSAATHTPGPWVVYPVSGLQAVTYAVGVRPTHGNDLLPIVKLVSGPTTEVARANAALIAAAPELLAALKKRDMADRAFATLCNMDFESRAHARKLDEIEGAEEAAIDAARAAIAKAEGSAA